MSGWHDAAMRAMYPGGRADARGRLLSHMWASVFGLGLLPERWVTLEVVGRRSGRVAHFPLGMADWNGHWYLVSMLGERCNWSGTYAPQTGGQHFEAGMSSCAGWSKCQWMSGPRSSSATSTRCPEHGPTFRWIGTPR